MATLLYGKVLRLPIFLLTNFKWGVTEHVAEIGSLSNELGLDNWGWSQIEDVDGPTQLNSTIPNLLNAEEHDGKKSLTKSQALSASNKKCDLFFLFLIIKCKENIVRVYKM